MSIIDFTHLTCKKNNNIMNKQIVENFEEHFAMYSLNTIKDIPNIEVSKYDGTYIVKGTEDECNEIINRLSSFRCSNFENTLRPVFTLIKEGLCIEFKIDRE